MKRKDYIETSVISYLTARPSKTILGAAHQQITLAWWQTRNQYELLVSESVLRECGAGDTGAAQKRLDVLSDGGRESFDAAPFRAQPKSGLTYYRTCHYC